MATRILHICSFLQTCILTLAQFSGNIPANGGFVSEGQLPMEPHDPWASLGYNFPSVPVNPNTPYDPSLWPQNPHHGHPSNPNPNNPGNRGTPVNPRPPQHPWQPGGGQSPSNPGGRQPSNPGGRQPSNPGGRQPSNPGGRQPSNPGGGNKPNTGGGTVVNKPQRPVNPRPERPVNPGPQRPSAPRPTPQARPQPTPKKPLVGKGGGVGSKPQRPATPGVVNPGNGRGPVVVDPVRPSGPKGTPPKRPGSPNNRGNVRPEPGATPRGPLITCAQNPCQNRGTCIDDFTKGFRCECRHLYLGEQCEIIISPPQHITINSIATTRASISWRVPPSIDEEISGFVVQYNKFGYENFHYSPFIHPSVADFTLTDLEPDSQYTVCVSIILINMSQTNAVLRDQCVEVRTRSLSLNETGLPVTMVAIILGGVVVALILIMLLALCCQRKCLQTRRAVIGAAATVRRARAQQTCEIHGNPKTPLAPRPSAGNPPKKEHEYSKPGPPVKERAPPKFGSPPNNRVLPHTRTQALTPKPLQLMQPSRKPDITTAHVSGRCIHANNGNNSASNPKDTLVIDIPPTVPEHDIAMDAIKKAARNPEDPAMQSSYYARSYSISSSEYTEHSLYGGSRNPLVSAVTRTTTHPPSSVFRALPRSVANHMMRIKNARDKDATEDFDMARTYFLPRA
ncbi:uncharacterized protein [Diadema setosum]|uniref:uncharacterized protein n=1 Tax=Diadema setosum TaxID=31175 RepID=UPI003B3B9061